MNRKHFPLKGAARSCDSFLAVPYGASTTLLFSPHLASPLRTLASAALCGCAKALSNRKQLTAKGAGIGPKILRRPGRGGSYGR